MARTSPPLLILIIAVLQHVHAAPSPEFGSVGLVQTSLTIKSAAASIGPLFEELDDNNGFVPVTDYDRFKTLLPLMESLGTKVATLGPPITNAIVAGVPKNDGNYNAVFNPISTAISAMKSFIDGEVASTRTTLTNIYGTDINHLFGDVFGNMRNALVQLDTNLQKLKTALQTAVIRSGKAQIDPNITSNLLASISLLKATILPVRYTVYTTLENVELSDAFLVDLDELSTVLRSNLNTYLTDFTNSVGEIGTSIKGNIDNTHTTLNAVDISDPITLLKTLPEFNSFSESLVSYLSVLNNLKSYPGKINDEVITQYLTDAGSYLTQYALALVPRSYDSITYLIEVLISGGPNSQFCFYKYKPRLINFYALLVSDVEACFSLEVFRVNYFIDLSAALLQVVSFDFEDLYSNLSACSTMTTPGACLSSITSYYIALTKKTVSKTEALFNLFKSEAKASTNRLGGCLYSRKVKNMQALMTATSDIDTCHKLGPKDPN